MNKNRGALVAGCVTTDKGKSFSVTCPITKQKMIFIKQGNIILGEII